MQKILMFHLYSGLGRPRISKKDLGNILLPVPDDPKVQFSIAEEGLRLEKEAIKLRAEARNLVREAKDILEISERRPLQMLEDKSLIRKVDQK